MKIDEIANTTWAGPDLGRALLPHVDAVLQTVTEPIGTTKLIFRLLPTATDKTMRGLVLALHAMRQLPDAAHLFEPAPGKTFGHRNIHWLPQHPAPYGREDDGTPIVPTARELAEWERVRRKYEAEQLKEML